MKTILLSKLLTLATEQCVTNKAELVSVGFNKDRTTLVISCERDNGFRINFLAQDFFEKGKTIKVKI